jgi:hypothetical protein
VARKVLDMGHKRMGRPSCFETREHADWRLLTAQRGRTLLSMRAESDFNRTEAKRRTYVIEKADRC